LRESGEEKTMSAVIPEKALNHLSGYANRAKQQIGMNMYYD